MTQNVALMLFPALSEKGFFTGTRRQRRFLIGDRLDSLVAAAIGPRLTYKELIA